MGVETHSFKPNELDNKLDNVIVLNLKLKILILSLILSLNLAKLMNQVKLKLLDFLISSNLNIICKLVSNSSLV